MCVLYSNGDLRQETLSGKKEGLLKGSTCGTQEAVLRRDNGMGWFASKPHRLQKVVGEQLYESERLSSGRPAD